MRVRPWFETAAAPVLSCWEPWKQQAVSNADIYVAFRTHQLIIVSTFYSEMCLFDWANEI
jgi:hypothetical protein